MRKGSHHTPETQAKMRKAWETREPASEETRARLSASLTGKPKSAEHRKKLSASKTGENNPQWRGGIHILKPYGYVLRLCPNHPYADQRGYVMEHRLVMESHLGRTLLQTEVVHHINGKVADNRLENLMLFSSVGEHTSFHRRKSIASSACRA